MQSIVGIEVNEIRSLGGGSKSKLWNQIKTDITQKPVLTFETEETACLGAAILAGKAIGIFPSLKEPCEKMVVFKECFKPNYDNLRTYNSIYETYIKLYQDLRSLFSMA